MQGAPNVNPKGNLSNLLHTQSLTQACPTNPCLHKNKADQTETLRKGAKAAQSSTRFQTCSPRENNIHSLASFTLLSSVALNCRTGVHPHDETLIFCTAAIGFNTATAHGVFAAGTRFQVRTTATCASWTLCKQVMPTCYY